MASARPNLGRRLRLAVAGAAVATALTTATAAAVVPSAQTSASKTTRPDPGSGGTGPRSEFPGFLLDRGRYRTIAAPDPGVELYPLGVNNRGQISGEYVRVGPDAIPDSESGFVRDQRGRTTVLDVPGAKGTEAVKINDRGQVVGQLRTDVTVPPADDPGTGGFLLAKSVKGPFTRVGFPGAPRSIANGLNDRGQIVGNYQNPSAAPSPQPAARQLLREMARALTAR
jgi:uncharacterized membrane protein